MTEVTRIAAAASAVRETLEQLTGEDAEGVDAEMTIVVRIESPESDVLRLKKPEETPEQTVRTVERVVADVAKRYGVSIKVEWR